MREDTLERIEAAGAILLCALPLAMAIANKSSPLVVVLVAATFTAAAFLREGRDALARILAPLASPIGFAALAFLAWCLISLAWTPLPELSLRVLREFAPTLVAAYLVARLAPDRLPDWAPRLAGLLLVLAGLYEIASLSTNMAPQRAFGQRDMLFVANRPVMTFLLLAGPIALLLALGRQRLASLSVVAATAAAILRSVSGAATMGLIAGTAMAALAWGLPRKAALAIVGIGLGLAIILAPVEGDVLEVAMPDFVHARLEHSSSRARVAIARSFGAAVAADPWRGAGFGTSGRFQDVPAAAGLAPEMRGFLSVGHPHNSFLQVWAELGLPGVMLAGLVLLLTLRALAAWPAGAFKAGIGLVAACAAIVFVEHGAWQAWWTAGLGAAIAWLRMARQVETRADTSA